MKRMIVGTLLILFSAGAALAAENITYETRIGKVVFPHKRHQNALNQCRICHEKGPGRIEGFSKELAHGKGCIGCHEERKIGPNRTSCKGCHKP